MSSQIVRLGQNWKPHLSALLLSAKSELLVCTPFVSIEGAEFVSTCLRDRKSSLPGTLILTDLSARSVAQGSTDPSAVAHVARLFPSATVVHLSRLHAKVFVADSTRAIVTSGNLTGGGLERNYEYGLQTKNNGTVQAIKSDLTEYSKLGAPFGLEELNEFAERAREVRTEFARAQSNLTRNAQRRLKAALAEIGDDLIRRQLGGGTVNAVFARTISYLLRIRGPMKNVELQSLIRNIHPDLCDDTIDRIIDGVHFGKKWKHQMRSAESGLKRKGEIVLIQGAWHHVNSLKAAEL